MAQANGTNVVLNVGAGILFGETSSEMQFSTDVFEITTKESEDRFKEFESGEHGFTGSAEMIITAADGAKVKAIIDAKDAGTPLSFVYGTSIVGDFKVEGNVIVTAVNAPAPKNEARTLSVEFQGTGKYTVAVVTA
jgi:predicted secreted protein